MYYESKELLLKTDLSLSFKGFSVLNGVIFEIHNTIQPGSNIPRGQVVSLLGPSGIGKTQLFRCIAGLQVPTEGGVYINGNTEPVKEGEVGVVAQDYPLIETRTVMGNLSRAFQVSGRGSEKEAVVVATDYLGHFGLAGITKRYPSQLSGGQRQRVAIIQQMMCSKHFLLMDEPFANLDILAKDAACHLIAEMAAADTLNTIIVTTHDIRMACASADRVITLGRDHDEQGKAIPGARVVGDYDLKALDLCWTPGITTTEKFLKFVIEIEQQFPNL